MSPSHRASRGRVSSRLHSAVNFDFIATSAIVAALLLPALIDARTSSRASRCQDNCRHIGVTFKQYTDGHDGRYAPFGQAGSYWTRSLARYTGFTQIWHCPGCLGHQGGNSGIGYSALLGGQLSPETQVVRSAATVAFGDTDAIRNPHSRPNQWRPRTDSDTASRLRFETPNPPAWKQASRRIWNRHVERANITFADGHAALMPVAFHTLLATLLHTGTVSSKNPLRPRVFARKYSRETAPPRPTPIPVCHHVCNQTQCRCHTHRRPGLGRFECEWEY